MIGLDTNVLVRYLVQDDPHQSPLATRAIATHCTRESPGLLNHVVLCETVWVLESAYGYATTQIISVLEQLFRTSQFCLQDPPHAWAALRAYRAGADFADGLIANINRGLGCEQTLTFDQAAAAAGMTVLRR